MTQKRKTPRKRPTEISRDRKAMQDDEISGEVAIRAHIDQMGLTVGGKSRLLAATDRLLGGIVGIPAAYFEGIRTRVEIRSSVRTEQARLRATSAIELLESLDETGKVTAQRFIAEEVRKQVNREAVWAETADAIKSLPAPDSVEPTDTSSALEEDWINLFANYAEKASSERLRTLWGRILAGEIRKPGSFALSTLRVISEMDAEIAAAFQEVMALRIQRNMLLKPDRMEGIVLQKWTFLEEAGLLQDVVSGLTWNFAQRPMEGFVMIPVQNYCLKIGWKPGFLIPFVKVTRIGEQIASILPWDELDALRQLASRVADQSSGLELGRITRPLPGLQRFELMEVIKPLETGGT